MESFSKNVEFEIKIFGVDYIKLNTKEQNSIQYYLGRGLSPGRNELARSLKGDVSLVF